jgi:hypothetical protein
MPFEILAALLVLGVGTAVVAALVVLTTRR